MRRLRRLERCTAGAAASAARSDECALIEENRAAASTTAPSPRASMAVLRRRVEAPRGGSSPPPTPPRARLNACVSLPASARRRTDQRRRARSTARPTDPPRAPSPRSCSEHGKNKQARGVRAAPSRAAQRARASTSPAWRAARQLRRRQDSLGSAPRHGQRPFTNRIGSSPPPPPPTAGRAARGDVAVRRRHRSRTSWSSPPPASRAGLAAGPDDGRRRPSPGRRTAATPRARSSGCSTPPRSIA